MQNAIVRGSWRYLLAVLSAALFVVGLAGVLLSPWALELIGTHGVDWSRASDIGQTYGAASAILSALALGGIGLSVILQVRANHQARIHAVRQIHADLIKLALDDPRYLPCWGVPHRSRLDERQSLYINLIISYWQARWDIGSLDAPRARAQASGFFQGEAPRLYWQQHGAARLAGTRRRRRGLGRILDDEYRRAIASGPPARPAVPRATMPARRSGSGAVVVGGLALVGAAGICLGRAWQKRATSRRV